MRWAWVWVLLGGLMDVGWAVGMTFTDGFTSPLPSILTLVCIAASYSLYALSIRSLPIGIAYAIFTGIGAAGTVLFGMLFLHEPTEWQRILFVLLLLYGIVGLKRSDKTITRQKPSTRQGEN